MRERFATTVDAIHNPVRRQIFEDIGIKQFKSPPTLLDEAAIERPSEPSKLSRFTTFDEACQYPEAKQSLHHGRPEKDNTSKARKRHVLRNGARTTTTTAIRRTAALEEAVRSSVGDSPRRRGCGCDCTPRAAKILLAAGLTLLLLREAAVRRVSTEDRDFVESLRPIRRVRLDDLDFEDYRHNHLLRAVPLIVELPVRVNEQLWDREAVLRQCGNTSVMLVSYATLETLDDIRGTALETVLNLLMRVFTSHAGVDSYVAARTEVSLGDVAGRIEHAARTEVHAAAETSYWRFGLSRSPCGLVWPIALGAPHSSAIAMLDAFLRVMLSPPCTRTRLVYDPNPALTLTLTLTNP